MSLIGVTRRIRHKNNDGTIIEAEIGAYARNVSEDEDHRFVTDKEKNGWNDKVSASGGDISDTKAAEFETSSASFPIPAAGETVKVILGKIKKHLEDLASWRPTVSLIANIVDNCTSTNADKPLSAKQGKVLQDQITQVNSDKADKNNPILTFSADNGSVITLRMNDAGDNLNLYLTPAGGGAATAFSLLSQTGDFISRKANAAHTAASVANIGGATSALFGHVQMRDEADESLTASKSVAATPAAVYKVYDIARTKALTPTYTGNGYVNTDDSSIAAFRVGGMVYVFFILKMEKSIPAKYATSINLILNLPAATATTIAIAGMTTSGEIVKVIIESGTTIMKTSANNPSAVNAGDTITGTLIYYAGA